MQQDIRGYRVSRQQHRRWLLSRAQPQPIRCVIRLTGLLQEDRLYAAVQQIISRQSILRTTLQQVSSRKTPIQMISQEANIIWTTEETSAEEALQRSEKFLSLTASSDYETVPLTCYLLKIAEHEHLFLLSISEFCADLSTAYDFIQQVAQEYSGTSLEDEEPIQYIQFSEWQHELLDAKDEEAEAGKHFWQQYQWISPTAVRLPYARHCTTPPVIYQETTTHFVEHTLVKELLALAEHYKAGFSSVLLSAWQTLIWRLTSQDHLLIGYFSTGREQDELANALGPFSTVLPIQCSLAENMRFDELLQQTETILQNALDWQDYVSWPGDEDAAYFFPLGFAYFEHTQTYQADQLTFRIEKQLAYEERFSWRLVCTLDGDELKVSVQYDPTLFTAEQMNYSLAQYEMLLNSIARRFDSLLYALEVRGPREQQLSLSGSHSADPVKRSYKHFPQLFEDQVERTPDALALVSAGQTFTYRELNARANQLAHYLQKYGVGPDTPVGLSVERSCYTIIGLLGIIKAGGAFAPLDIAQPEQRLASLLEDVHPPVILTQFTQPLPVSFKDQKIINLRTDWAEIARESTTNPSTIVDERTLVYLIFTSGSTGKPKGVAVEHRQLAHYIAGIQHDLALPEQASYALVSSIQADLGHTMLFPALCSGGSLHFLTEEQLSSAEELIEYAYAHPIDCLKIAPSHLQALFAATKHPEALLPRKRLILGGESSTWNLVQKVHELAPDCVVFNHYGPTETTVGVMTYRADHTLTEPANHTLPLSQLLAGASLYLLDSHLQPIPVGAIGEIYIGGMVVSRGYTNRPALTAERFIPNPFSDQPGERLYKTGDLACLLADGVLQIVGRSDNQVKFHGHRLELQELRYVLNQHPDIQDSVVVVRQDRQGRDILVAYYVARVPLNYTELREWLARWIPEEIRPNTYIHLPRLPLRPNGKPDYEALPPVEEARQERKHVLVAPRTALEASLVAIWSRILRMEQISIEDNFFELWGDSILGIQMIAAAGEAGIDITLKQLFEHPTIAELATVATLREQVDREAGPITGAVPLTPIQHWFFEQDLPHPEQWGVAVLLEAEDTFDADLVEQTLEQLYSHHDILRCRFKRNQTQWECEIVDPQQPHPPLLHRRDLPLPDQQEEATPVLLQELFASLNLAEGPLVQSIYLEKGFQRGSQLWLVVHRLLIDGYSWRLLLEQFQQVYRQLSQGAVTRLPAKTTSYQRWAEHLLTYARSEALQQQADYWIN
ncbi:MAG TPA: amino acid adenylation domain-containing protein, partial [Ktedonobacteraceae bacterium]|nr:amino acid adenylation domain-containing protein [Ktedonobacteraceae bacterium]